MHFTVCCVVVVLASIASVASAPVEDVATPGIGSSFTGASTLGSDPDLGSSSGGQAYAVPGDSGNPGVSSDPDSKSGASTLEYVPESDNFISTSDTTQLNEASKSFQVAANPTESGDSAPIIVGDCKEDRSECDLCISIPDGRTACGRFKAKCGDDPHDYHCTLSSQLPADEKGPAGIMEIEVSDISHLPSPDNPNGQKWCKNCPKPPVEKPATCIPFTTVCW